MQLTQKAQVGLFIMMAIMVIAAALFSYFFIIRKPALIPTEIQPVESYFQECVNELVEEAVAVASLQGGYIELPEFEPGSEYVPFSSQLNFMGWQIPYWFYISQNNLVREQKPSLAKIEKQFSDYLFKRVKECEFDTFIEQGYDIDIEGEPIVNVEIKKDSIETKVDWPFTISYQDQSARITEHKIETESSFGKLYDIANSIFEAEQEQLFLENYALDVLRLYAPVTGIEIRCAPKTWLVSEVKSEINEALEGNIAAIKISGTYYDIEPEHEYFEIDIGKSIDETVYFLYDRNMPHVFEVWPSEDNLMRAEPLGTQPGLGMLSALGFCYVPYHFVYDLKFPVLVQVIGSERELFQFPTLVIIDKNAIRNATVTETEEVLFDICQYKNQEVTVFTYDENSRPIEADISYKCFNQMCDVGKTVIQDGKAVLTTMVPQCYNGFVVAKAAGYTPTKLQSPGIESFIANIFLKPQHTLDVEVELGPGEYATITFNSESHSTSIYYPEQKEITLVEGTYNTSVYLFKEATMVLESQRVEQCIEIPATGIAGVFGAMTEQCFEIDTPAETLTSIVFGGGKGQFSVTELELTKASKIIVNAPSYDVPKNLLNLADTYALIDTSEVQITLR